MITAKKKIQYGQESVIISPHRVCVTKSRFHYYSAKILMKHASTHKNKDNVKIILGQKLTRLPDCSRNCNPKFVFNTGLPSSSGIISISKSCN